MMVEISPKDLFLSPLIHQMEPIGITELAGIQRAVILAMLISLLWQALAIIAWNLCLALWRAISNSVFISFTYHYILEVELAPNMAKFKLLKRGELGGAERGWKAKELIKAREWVEAKKLVRVVAGITMIALKIKKKKQLLN